MAKKFEPIRDTITVPAASIKSLDQLKIEINAEYAYGLSMAQKATETMINVGKLLLQAREKFKGDNEFGKWRQKHIEFSASHASRLMAVAREFGEIQDAYLMPLSTLAELLPADAKLKDEIVTNVAAGGKPPTVAEARRLVKEAKNSTPNGVPITPAPDPDPEPPHCDTAPAAPGGDGGARATDPVPPHRPPSELSPRGSRSNPPQDPEQALVDKVSHDILLPFEVRVKNFDDPFVIFGLSPFFEGTINEDVIRHLYDWYCTFDLIPKHRKSLDNAMAQIKLQLFSTDAGLQVTYGGE